jgi:DNA polymerase III alpha subunit (gram-positive type)
MKRYNMFVFLDTETTGTDEDDRLCQIALKTEAGLIVNELFNPGKPISIEAMSIHHITDEMVSLSLSVMYNNSDFLWIYTMPKKLHHKLEGRKE